MDMKIQMRDGSLVGKTLSIPNIVKAFDTNVRRVRNRWSVAIVRTSGSIFIDLLILYIKLIIFLFGLFFRAIFGTRKTVKSLIKGIRISSKRVEDVKEAETFIFISVAALYQAMKFAGQVKTEDVLDGDSILDELSGLTFSSARIGKRSSGYGDVAEILLGDEDGGDEEDEDEDADEGDSEIDYEF
jgi:hypothetical protein